MTENIPGRASVRFLAGDEKPLSECRCEARTIAPGFSFTPALIAAGRRWVRHLHIFPPVRSR